MNENKAVSRVVFYSPLQEQEMKRLGKIETISDARKELTRFIRSFHNNTTTEQEMRTIVYSFSALLAFMKAEKEIEIESRIEAIEQELKLK